MHELQREGVIVGEAQIIEARIPIIKCMITGSWGLQQQQNGGGTGTGTGTSSNQILLAADISLGATNGAQAVSMIRRQVLAVPPLRPLTLVVKAILRERGLAEVFSGGLSSYTLTNMVLAHLQCEGYTIADLDDKVGGGMSSSGSGGLQETFNFLYKLSNGNYSYSKTIVKSLTTNTTGPTTIPAAAATSTGKKPVETDLGLLLWSFFDRFGRKFAYARQAVSVRSGGLCNKIAAWRNERKPWLLAVEDPQQPGKDIGYGSFAIADIRSVFAVVAEALAECCEDEEANAEAMNAAALNNNNNDGGGGGNSSRSEQQQQQNINFNNMVVVVNGGGVGTILGSVLDAEAAVGRGQKAHQARHLIREKANEKAKAMHQYRMMNNVRTGRVSKPGRSGGGGRGAEAAAAAAAAAAEEDKARNRSRRRERRAAISAAAASAPPSRKAGSKGSGGGNSGAAASRAARQVQAQWSNKRGQYFDNGDDDGGGGYGGGGEGWGGGYNNNNNKSNVWRRTKQLEKKAHHQQQHNQPKKK